MTAVDLAEGLERALDEMTEETYDSDLVAAYLDALDEKAPMPGLPNTETEFAAFQARIDGLSGACSSKPKNTVSGSYKVRRTLLTAAAAAAVLLALLIGAQAAGFDVLGAVARWTDETFQFVPSAGASGSLLSAAWLEQGPPCCIS